MSDNPIFDAIAWELDLCWERDASCPFDCNPHPGWPIRTKTLAELGWTEEDEKANFVVDGWDFKDPVTGEFSRDRFWEQKVFWAGNGDRTPDGAHCLRINGFHYTAEPRIFKPRGFMGMGGRRQRWRELATGKVYESNDIWCQDRIPANFQDRLPNNAEWVSGWWCGGCQEYHEGDHCPKTASWLKELWA